MVVTLASSQNPQKKLILIIADFWVGVSEFFIGEFSPNFYLKNMILTYTKDFSLKKWPNCQILKEINSELLNLYARR
jgi:hypothetical protein